MRSSVNSTDLGDVRGTQKKTSPICVEEIVFVALGVLLRREQNGTKPGVSQHGAFRPWPLVPMHLSMLSCCRKDSFLRGGQEARERKTPEMLV